MQTDHEILQKFHILMTNIVLLNFLIALLSSAYEAMLEIGNFTYKVNKY